MATTGRVQVSPGQTIQSTQWGNVIWDQSLNCFQNNADRANQWPTPHEGSLSWLDDGKNLWVYRSGAWRGIPTGWLTSATGPAGTTDFVAYSTAVSVSFSAVQGRRYRITGYANGTQVTATGGVSDTRISDDQGGVQAIFYASALAVNQPALATGVMFYAPTTTKTATIIIQARATAGALRIGVNACSLNVEDIGS